ncbi:type IV pilus modification PilV family protein [Lignipirellula cremea]|uniref:Prepilin-type N-terminal cleavage/methylation domain-containing protein n=1 Tax=Lignipirellula cremea TaxID=2528010 RepID=A0A518DSE2_9BACT|nr:prepilin-type N-terminal cleavage/methylation domain-containing protein [Lignipirellula cremea]QDU94757.1 hypothetical protein Pla8534_25640 [Lignipirellula cremea]
MPNGILSTRTSNRQRRGGFTLVEAMTALTVASMAGAMILLAVETSVQTTHYAMEETIAMGMAKQLVDEVLGCRYTAPGGDPYQYPFSANSYEKGGNGRERFNDTDDFVDIETIGAKDIWNQPLGDSDNQGGLRPAAFRAPENFFADWKQEIDVYYVDNDDLSQRLPAGWTSDHRAVEAIISRKLPNGEYQELARLRRVFAYVPH